MSIIFLFRQGKGTQEVRRLSSSFNAGEAEIERHKPYDFGSIMRKINGRRFALFHLFKKEGVRPLFTKERRVILYGRSYIVFSCFITFGNNDLHNNKKITAPIAKCAVIF